MASTFPVPDVLLLSEVDRGCARTDFRNIARDYAERLGYYYVYATEFVELPGDRGHSGPVRPPRSASTETLSCRATRSATCDKSDMRRIGAGTCHPRIANPDEPRLGGRIAIAADAKIGTALVRFYVLHLESTLSTLDIRDAQAEEIAADGEGVSYPVIAGGDLNTFFYYDDLEKGIVTEPAVKSFIDRGHDDAHQRFRLVEPLHVGRSVRHGHRHDLRPEASRSSRRTLSTRALRTLSDHLPVFVEVGGVLGE